MCLHQDLLRAVRLYIKLGKRVGLAIRQLGYPIKNALKSWHLESICDVQAPVLRCCLGQQL